MSLENNQLQKIPVNSKKYQSAKKLYPDAYFSGRAQLRLMFEHLNLDIQLLCQGKDRATPLFRLWNVLQLKMISIIMEVELSQLITLGL